MNNRLTDAFARLHESESKALMPFITAGYPDRDKFMQVANVICQNGADVLEIGFPHSDPLADGPVIQHASHTAISGGFTVESGFEQIKSLTTNCLTPVVVMCYTNLLLRMEVRKFIRHCAISGVSGLIVPDMIIEESVEVSELCRSNNIAFINLVTPTTLPERAMRISEATTGFIYLVSVTGTTGARARITTNIKAMTARLRRCSNLPVCVGFGVSSPEMAGEMAKHCDGVIIGSKILSLIDGDNGNQQYTQLRNFLSETRMKLGASHG